MTDLQFANKDEIALKDLLLELEDNGLFDVQTVNTTTKGLWKSFQSL